MRSGFDVGFAFEKGDGLAQVADRDDLEALDSGGFGGVVGGDEDAHFAIGLGAEGDGEHAFDGADSAGQGEFADHDEVIELIGAELFAGGEDANGDGEIEAGSFLFDVGRGEVDRGPAHGEFEPGIVEGGADAVARFFDGGMPDVACFMEEDGSSAMLAAWSATRSRLLEMTMRLRQRVMVLGSFHHVTRELAVELTVDLVDFLVLLDNGRGFGHVPVTKASRRRRSSQADGGPSGGYRCTV
jgi:hypothetical protein